MSEKIAQLNKKVIKGQIKELMGDSVEETLNELLEAEAEKLIQAARYECNEQCQGLPQRSLQPESHHHFQVCHAQGAKVQRGLFKTAIIERYRRRKSSVEETLIEMYLAGVSVRRVEDITEALWGSKVSLLRKPFALHIANTMERYYLPAYKDDLSGDFVYSPYLSNHGNVASADLPFVRLEAYETHFRKSLKMICEDP